MFLFTPHHHDGSSRQVDEVADLPQYDTLVVLHSQPDQIGAKIFALRGLRQRLAQHLYPATGQGQCRIAVGNAVDFDTQLPPIFTATDAAAITPLPVGRQQVPSAVLKQRLGRVGEGVHP
jgi:hypothetical protein